MKRGKESSSINPVVLTLFTLVGLFILVVFFYLFYKTELNDAIYTSVLSETKSKLQNTVSSYIKMLEKEKELSEERHKNEIKEEVRNAWAVANSIYNFCKKRRCRDETIKLLIKNALKSYRFFDGMGYVFIDTVKGKVVLNPAFPEIEGRSLWNWKDTYGKFVHRSFERVVLYSPEGEGFVSYHWYKPHTKEVDLKISYVKLFKPYNWIIGGGVYASQIKEKVKEHILSVGKAFDAFIFDLSHSKEVPSPLKGVDIDKLKRGVFVKTEERFYFFKYYPDWNWVIGAYATNNELLRNVYYLQSQFLTRANKIIASTSTVILAIIAISSITLLNYNRKLSEMIKELKKKRRELLKLTRNLKLIAYKDDITGLPNRKKLFDDLSKIGLSRNIHFALVNIRNFRDLNELFGFEDGNRILRAFGQNLKKEVKRKCKNCLVYRIRGDKFGVLACDLNDAQFIELMSRLIRNLESKEFEVNNIKFKLDVVSGISKNRDNLLIEAEIAEEEAKRRNLNIYVFDKELERTYESLEKNLKIAMMLKEAVEKKKVIPFFQPIVELESMKVFEYEALMRIKTPEEILNPGQFLAVAKKIAIYRKLSKALLEEAFKMCAEHRINISVNLSTEDLASKSMVNWITAALKHYDIADKVCFEVVETEAFSDMKILENFYYKIKELGAYLAIDDFGSGYSNYEYLATIKPDFVKIDGSLISKTIKSKDVERLVKHIVMFCKDLEIKTIAEFVSSRELYVKVKELGVHYGQGYYFGKPSPEIRSE
ncbi:EAL domain-containing protein [Thermovibrio sp.]